MRTLVIGGGLVGSAVAGHCDGTIAENIRWDHLALASADLEAVVREHCSNGPWAVAWCAGVGVVGSTRKELEQESLLLSTVLDAMWDGRKNGRFLLTSSGGGLHGGTNFLRVNEMTPPMPISPYGWAKYAQEDMVTKWAKHTGVPTVIARPSNVYGPSQRLGKPQGFISQVLWKTITGEPLLLSVPWETQRDFIYADDAGRRMADLLCDVKSGIDVRVVASGKSVTLSHVASLARQITGRSPTVTEMGRAGDQPAVLRFSTIHESFDAQITLRQGMTQTWEYLCNLARHPARGSK